jgi:hypothetical protein
MSPADRPEEDFGRCSYKKSLLNAAGDMLMRKTLLAGLLLTLTMLETAFAGPLFDDYLNYVRPGIDTGPGDVTVFVTSAQPVGQSFVLPENTGEVYRIGVRPAYDSWGEGEEVTLSLYDSPEKANKLGSYTIDYLTSRVDEYKIGNGASFDSTGDFVLYFQLRSQTSGKRNLYFELSVKGGDGKVGFQGLSKDTYAEGNMFPAGSAKDVSFDCHIKLVADREANLKKFFTERLDITNPALAAVKAAVEEGDWEKAIAETVKHFHERMDLWDDWKDEMVPKPDPSADTSSADLLLQGKIKLADTKQPYPWRKESWWAGIVPTAKQPNHAFDPSPYLWHIDRHLAAAYTATAKPEYAAKAIELRMQFILDNPNPKVVHGGKTPFKWYFELWNDRTAGGRSPGHGRLVYARLYNYPGWTNDQKLVFFSFIEDNARWTYLTTSGANWGAEAARACLDFGLEWPEWKMSKDYVNWGSIRLAEISMESVRRDGTSTEAAIKYHAMVARRLKGMVEDCLDGKLEMGKDKLQRVKSVLERMYEVMAYTLQPNSKVVMCGDSWYEDYTEGLAQVGKLLGRSDFVWVATQGKEGKPPADISKAFPDGGYYIMRSDFGGSAKNYADARQLFIHNGNWFGSHGHWDLTSINLFAFGRTLIVDPGQYSQQPPPGIDSYWSSSVHSMLVMNGRDVKREAGPSTWVSNSVSDWFDGRHYGYNSVGYVRRRVIFVKPNYFVVDDSVKDGRDAAWAQVWNIPDPSATYDAKTGIIQTNFSSGGNLIIANQDPGTITLNQADGITASGEAMPKTRIFRLTRQTLSPRFISLLYPYKGTAKPDFEWERIAPDDKAIGDLHYSLRVKTPGEVDWIAFGEVGRRIAFRDGRHALNADSAVVRLNGKNAIRSFSWARGKEITFDRKLLAASDNEVTNLAVSYDDGTIRVTAVEPDSTLRILVGGATRFVLNGKLVAKPRIEGGYFKPFSDLPKTIIADDRDSFETITQGQEWEQKGDSRAWFGGYTRHETDPGRHETGNYVIDVPKMARYSVEVFLGQYGVDPSDRTEYTIDAVGKPADIGGPIVEVRQTKTGWIVVLNHQAGQGWVSLGSYALEKGKLKVNARNDTSIDGLYFIADAMRLVEKK